MYNTYACVFSVTYRPTAHATQACASTTVIKSMQPIMTWRLTECLARICLGSWSLQRGQGRYRRLNNVARVAIW